MPVHSLTDSLRDAIPLTKCRDHIPGRPHTATVWRWAVKGCRGVKLATWMAGGKRVTTPSALEAFLRRLNPEAEAITDGEGSVVDIERRAKETSKALSAFGI